MAAAGSLHGAGVETLRWLVEHGADLDRRSEDGDRATAAWYASGPPWSRKPLPSRARAGLRDRLRFLLDAGLDARECAANGCSLLAEAARVGDPPRVRLLLERGADPDPGSDRAGGHPVPKPRSERNRSGERKFISNSREWIAERRRPNPFADRPSSFQIPLFCAAASGSVDCVRLLLAAGVAPDTVDDDGATALFCAGSAEVARTLLEAGADPFVVDHPGYDPLQTVIEGERALVASGPGRFGIARVLIEAGADLERRDCFGHTRLYSCAFRRAAEAVRFLLQAGAAPRAPQGGGRTALHAVCWQSEGLPEAAAADERIIDLLVGAGIPVDQPDDDGFAPIHEAAGADGGNATAVRALLRHGAQPDLLGRRGFTPLMVAAFDCDVECIGLLLEASADPLRKDQDGQSSLDRARARYRDWLSMVRKNPPEYAKALKQAGEALLLLETAAGEAG
jgi:ankyrin repeat protein